MMTRIPRWSHRIGLLLAAPFLLFALVLAGTAVWEARPLPACGASGIDPLNPVLRCRRLTMVGGIPVPSREAVSASGLRVIEQGTVSGMPDLRSSGLAFLCGLVLYGLSRGFGRVLSRRRTALM
ncbi:hypothetical protein [uncultured Methylobacterium sp.]|uniref:hypothetical protein n=1 Tax=uncultured Methylobacterium sp. TaxID=157278 RepID=UPI0035C9E702